MRPASWPAHAEAGDPGRLFEDEAPFLRLGGKELVDLALLHDGVGRLADPRVEEELAHFAQLHGIVVDEVLALPRAVQAALDGDLGQLQGEHLVLVGDQEGHLRHAQGLAGLRPGEDHVHHVLRAEGLRGLLAEHPLHGVHDVALAAPVGPEEGRDPVRELDLHLVCEGFESEYLESL